MFVRNGAVTPGPSRECDITFFLKGRPKSARQSRDSTVAARRAQSVTVPSSRVSRECRSPGLRSPPIKNARIVLGHMETQSEKRKRCTRAQTFWDKAFGMFLRPIAPRLSGEDSEDHPISPKHSPNFEKTLGTVRAQKDNVFVLVFCFWQENSSEHLQSSESPSEGVEKHWAESTDRRCCSNEHFPLAADVRVDPANWGCMAMVGLLWIPLFGQGETVISSSGALLHVFRNTRIKEK